MVKKGSKLYTYMRDFPYSTKKAVSILSVFGFMLGLVSDRINDYILRLGPTWNLARLDEGLLPMQFFGLFPLSDIGLVSMYVFNIVGWVVILGHVLLVYNQNNTEGRLYKFLYYIKRKWLHSNTLAVILLGEQFLQYIFFAHLVERMPIFTLGISVLIILRLLLDSLDYFFNLSLGSGISTFEFKLQVGLINMLCVWMFMLLCFYAFPTIQIAWVKMKM
jgi:hypothetical protein